jgi:hypothetical protein
MRCIHGGTPAIMTMVPEREQKELVAILAPLRKGIAGR